MQRIKDQLQKIAPDSPSTRNSSRNTVLVTADKLRAVCAIINKVRIARGWNILPAEEAEITASVWIEILDGGGVPFIAYDALYRAAIQARTRQMSIGNAPPDITPDLLVSLWIGENGLKNEFYAERDAEVRKLPSNVEGECPHCFGSGLRYHTDRDTGRVIGVGGICDHN